jgi:hypothetical protein
MGLAFTAGARTPKPAAHFRAEKSTTTLIRGVDLQ